MSATEHRRLTLADAYRDAQHVIEQLTTRTATEPSASVEISRNAKGEPQFTVKVYAPASAAPEDVERATGYAYDQAVQAFEALRAGYPFTGEPPKERGAKEVAAIAANVAKRNAKAAKA